MEADAKSCEYIEWVVYPGSEALGESDKTPPARRSAVLAADGDVSSMVVSAISDNKLRLIGSIVEDAAPRGRPTTESIELRVGSDEGGTEDMS